MDSTSQVVISRSATAPLPQSFGHAFCATSADLTSAGGENPPVLRAETLQDIASVPKEEWVRESLYKKNKKAQGKSIGWKASDEGSPGYSRWSRHFDSDSAAEVFTSLGRRWTKCVAWIAHGPRRDLGDPSLWVNLQLHRPGMIALMLPQGASPWPEKDQVEPGQKLLDRCSVDTTFCGVPHRIWMLELEHPRAVMEEECLQLHWLETLAENATSDIRPASGPWIWPLHNTAVCAAILTAYMAQVDRLSWWRQLLWAVRILPPPGGNETERQLATHYGASVAYVFAWSNLYIRGLWSLVIILVFAWCLNTEPNEVGSFRGIFWNIVQIGTLVWACFMAEEGHSQRRVLNIGGFDDLAANLSRTRRRQKRRQRNTSGHTPGEALLREGSSSGESIASEQGSLDSGAHTEVKTIFTDGTCATRCNLLDVGSGPGSEASSSKRPATRARHRELSSDMEATTTVDIDKDTVPVQLPASRSRWGRPTFMWQACLRTVLPIWAPRNYVSREPGAQSSSVWQTEEGSVAAGRFQWGRGPFGAAATHWTWSSREHEGPSPHGGSASPGPAADPATIQAVIRLQAAVRGYLARRAFRKRLDHRAMLAAHVSNSNLLKPRNWAYVEPKDTWDQRRQFLIFALVAFATITLFTVVCVTVLLVFVQLNIYLTFIWGRCLDPEVQKEAAAKGQMCRDPQFVHGIAGWLAEVSSDVSLAVLFDVALAEASRVLARFVIWLRNYELLHDRRYATVMLSVFIEALSKVGMFSILGLVFLPQWHETNDPSVSTPLESCASLPDYRLCRKSLQCDMEPDGGPDCCSGILLCISQRLEYSQRRVMFERAVKGPFCVAPFVRILVTVIIPLVVGLLAKFVQSDARLRDLGQVSVRGLVPARQKGGSRCKMFFAPICRVLALIFYLQSDNVGGWLNYIAHGWPYGHLELVSKDDKVLDEEVKESRLESAHGALDQVSRKLFEPFDEVMELKMNFLFVSFFAPIMPIGLVPTLVARLLEVRSKATKLFFVRRRCWPGDSRILHQTQDAFARLAAQAAIIWHTGLVCIAYNPYLADWSPWKVAGIWFASIFVVTVIVTKVSAWIHRLRRRISRRWHAQQRAM